MVKTRSCYEKSNDDSWDMFIDPTDNMPENNPWRDPYTSTYDCLLGPTALATFPGLQIRFEPESLQKLWVYLDFVDEAQVQAWRELAWNRDLGIWPQVSFVQFLEQAFGIFGVQRLAKLDESTQEWTYYPPWVQQ